MRLTRALLGGILLFTLVLGSSRTLVADEGKAASPVVKATAPGVVANATTPVPVVKKDTPKLSPLSPLTPPTEGHWWIKGIGLGVVVLLALAGVFMIPGKKSVEDEPPMVPAEVPPLRKVSPVTQFSVYK